MRRIKREPFEHSTNRKDGKHKIENEPAFFLEGSEWDSLTRTGAKGAAPFH
jgi:hypothetical protein